MSSPRSPPGKHTKYRLLPPRVSLDPVTQHRTGPRARARAFVSQPGIESADVRTAIPYAALRDGPTSLALILAGTMERSTLRTPTDLDAIASSEAAPTAHWWPAVNRWR